MDEYLKQISESELAALDALRYAALNDKAFKKLIRIK